MTRKPSSSFFSYSSWQEPEQEEEINPFEAIFGHDIYKSIRENRHYVEKLKFSEFKQIEWAGSEFPFFIVDLFRYIAAFNPIEHLK